MKTKAAEENESPIAWFGIISAFLTVINNIIATLALGVFQGPIVAFTTPLAFCLAKLKYPKWFGATLIYLPLVIVSIFTINFGPPGPYKILFLSGAILYDFVCLITRTGREKSGRIPLWKLIIATVFYPIGLFAGAYVAIQWTTVEIPIISKALTGAILMVLLFFVVGSFANYLGHRVFYKWLNDE